MQNAERKISVLVADDHPVLREGVAAVLHAQDDMSLVGEAEDGAAAVRLYRELKPDVVLMDLEMPHMGGVEAIEAIRRESPEARIVVLTTYKGDVQALRAIKAGAVAYLLKISLRKELVDTIREVHAGRRRVSPEIADTIAVHAADEQLSGREIEILRAWCRRGALTRRFAWRLSISEQTVKAHLKSIFGKLDVADRTHAVTVAARRGIITL